MPGAAAQEIHVDSSGILWITEADGNAVRQFNPATGVYTDYAGIGSPGDAQIGPDGNLWWTGDDFRYLGRMNVATRLVTTWTVAAFSPLGLAFDGSGRVWFMDDDPPGGAYRFNPATNQLCQVDLPAVVPGRGSYIVEHNGALWLGDQVNGGIGRITPTTNAYTFWTINPITPAVPYALAFAPNGDVWYTDYSQGKIGRLEPAANRARLYGTAGLNEPAQLAFHAGKVWFTQEFDGNVSFVDPAVAAGEPPLVVTPTLYTLSPVCASNPVAGTFTAPITTGVASFSPVVLGLNANPETTPWPLRLPMARPSFRPQAGPIE